MPSPVSVSPPRTPLSSPSTATDGSPRSPRIFATRWTRFSRWTRYRSLLLVLLAAGACHTGPPRGSADARLTARARLLRIEDTRRDEPALVDSLLGDPDPRLRSAAALAAARIGARGHLPALRRLAADGDSSVAATALFALGLLKDTSAAPLASAALRGAPSVATEAAWLLGEIGEAGRPAIVAALRDTALAADARGAVLLAATRLRPVPAMEIAPWVASSDSALAWRAAYALARGRSAAGARTLLRAAASPWSAVREQAARGLSRSIAGDSLTAESRAALVTLVVDGETRVRVNAVRSLASYGRAAAPLVSRALRDAHASVRLAAAQSLEQVLDESESAWRTAWDADTAFVVRRAVAAGAAKHGLLADEWGAWRNSSSWGRRAAAAEVAAPGPAAATLDRLGSALVDPDGRVRAAAAGALAEVADSAAARTAIRERMRLLLRDTDAGVRAAAFGALARGATVDDLARALDSYELARRDTDADARFGFWTLADSAIRRSDALPEGVARRLETLGRPADPLERALAARIGRFAGWSDGTGTARPMEWYQARAHDALASRAPVLRVETERGVLELALFHEAAPLTVFNVTSLARRGYFDGQRFHRVVPNFVVQGGDPRGDGSGGPGYAIRDELNRHRYARGTLGMALSGPNTGGSQFFVTHSPQPHLDGGYTVFGQLLSGGDVLDRIVQGDRIVRVTVR
jgi:cyclophilin family peptidyl-prolyl cis-trans isomerase/HEAT repeat protein